jgi:primosomal protein N' (replication factor Y)
MHRPNEPSTADPVSPLAGEAEARVCRVVIVPPAGETSQLDYEIGPSLRGAVRPGMRVLVPLGARRSVAVVTELAETSTQPRLKMVHGIVDPQPLLDEPLLQLCRWLADYYLCSLGDALSAALPGGLRVTVERVATIAAPAENEHRPLATAEHALLDWLASAGPQPTHAVVRRFGSRARRLLTRLQRAGRIGIEDRLRGADAPTKRERSYRAACDADSEPARQWRARRPAAYAVFAYLAQHPLGRARAAELHGAFANAAAKLRALVTSGLVAVIEEEVYREVLSDSAPADRTVPLTEAQRAAVDAVVPCIGTAFRPFLLWGVTGSGKTEVYLQCIAACLAAARTALVLVPEISLTHQLVDRVRARFGERVAVLHSGLTDGERWDQWRKIARSEVSIVVGARSAVFAPLPGLGLVVVDEEHDAAYKQEDGIRYNARDVAVVRARLAGCPIVLGSATPSMETFHNGRSGRYALLTLPERVAARPLPVVDIVDLRRSGAAARAIMVSAPLAAALKANLAAHGQSLVFLNRRGFANFLQCHQCGDPVMCSNCSVTLTWHRRWQALRCHHCGYTVPPPAACPSCGGLSLGAWGAGTEQVEAALRRLVVGARIGRMDRDTTSRKGAQRKILAAWERCEYDVLVGTQMITKGHDIPGVTLVGVLLADQSLNFPDFRAAERTFQLLTQVAGRAGRGERPGRVIVQTLQPQHYSLQYAAHHDYRGFAELELAHRRETSYPPFTRLVLIRCEGDSAEASQRIATTVAAQARQSGVPGVAVLGPTPAPLERLRRRHRWHLLLRAQSSAAVRQAAARARHAVRRQARAAGVRLIVDVDPYNTL